jgi:hypothetical protein
MKADNIKPGEKARAFPSTQWSLTLTSRDLQSAKSRAHTLLDPKDINAEMYALCEALVSAGGSCQTPFERGGTRARVFGSPARA